MPTYHHVQYAAANENPIARIPLQLASIPSCKVANSFDLEQRTVSSGLYCTTLLEHSYQSLKVMTLLDIGVN